MHYGLSQEQFEPLEAIKLFIQCLYVLSDFSPLIVPYFSFCSNANSPSNPRLTEDVKQIIEDFHKYFYMERNIKYMNSGIFDDLPGLIYGNETVSFPIRDVLNLITSVSGKSCIKNLTQYVFNLTWDYTEVNLV